MNDPRIDRRAFLRLVARGVAGVIGVGAAFQVTGIGWAGTPYSRTMAANTENPQGATAPAAAPIIDTHAHLQARGPHHRQSDFGGAAAEALEGMDREGISRTIIMPPPFGPDSPGRYDFEELASAIGEHSSRLSCLGGGGTLNPMLHDSVRAGTIDAALERNFEARAREIIAGGALGFGEMSCEHLSFNPHHPYTSAPPDHPLMLRLAEIAAQTGVAIDLHMEAVRADMPTPPRFLERSPNNPPTLKANIDRFRALLASNRKASIIWSHAGWDNTGDRTVMLCEDLLSSNPNLYMSLKIDSVSLPQNRPVTAEGTAKPGWLALVGRFADRFLIGSDNFYDAPGVNLRDLPRAAEVLNFVRQLPADAQTKIATENPLRLYRSLNA
jgi:hypothetical protein